MPSPDGRKRVTLTDVAAYLGVSRATVSYALTRPNRVSDETRARVQDAIRKLGYRGNAVARQLRVGHSPAIAVVVSDAANPIFSSVLNGAEEAADQRGGFVVLANSAEDPERERKYLEFFEQQQVAGIVIAPVAELPEVAVAIRERGTPVAHLGTEDAPFDLSFVTGDDEAGGALAIRHLFETGRRRPLFLRGPRAQFRFRRHGAVRAATELGLHLAEIEIPAATIRASYEAATQILETGEFAYDSVFAGNDLIGIGFVHAALEHHVRIPQDVAVIGYDDIAFAGTTIVPLTTIRHDMHAMGMDLVRLLQEEPGSEPTSIRHAPALVSRRSTEVIT